MSDAASAAADRPTADVVVVGDGPAGSALAGACVRCGVDVVLVGPDDPWAATYGLWADDLAGVDPVAGTDVFGSRLDSVRAYGARRHDIDRPYGVVDNAALRDVLRAGVETIAGSVTAVEHGSAHQTVVLGDRRIRARLVVDATGWPARFVPQGAARSAPAWQTAFGVVLPEPPDGELGEPTLMDLRAVSTSASSPTVPTFAYALPVDDGWLVEETVLAARPAVAPSSLVPRLAGRLGRAPDDLLSDAIRTEAVHIPMGGPSAARSGATVAFGAAAGYVNPTTGYSLAASLRAAPRVATAIADALRLSGEVDAAAVWEAVWPAEARRTRILHDYGLELLVRLDPAEVREFFDLFFELPVEDWGAYLRVDAAPTGVSRAMLRLFRSASWPMRRRLAGGNPLALGGLLRP